MLPRFTSSIFTALALGAIVAALSSYFLFQSNLESERRYVKESVDRRTQAIEGTIWSGIRQLDLLAAYFEASESVDTDEFHIFLTNIWAADRNMKEPSNLPHAMGWIEKSGISGGSLVEHLDGIPRKIDGSDAFTRILKSFPGPSHELPPIILLNGRVDRGETSDENETFYSFLKPVFRATSNGSRDLRGFAFAIVELREMIAGTTAKENPFVRAYFGTGGLTAGGSKLTLNRIVDETVLMNSAGLPFVSVWAPASREITVADHTLRIEFFRDRGWSYMRAAPIEVLEDEPIRNALFIGALVTLIITAIGFYRSQQHLRLQEYADKANAAAQARTDFLATMSHEIRTPMNGIFGMAELLGNTGLTKQQRKYVDTVLFSAEILLRIIDDILDFAKLDIGKMKLDPIPTDLVGTLSQVTTLLSTKARDRAVEMLIDIQPGTPEGVIIDPGRFKQVVMNLVGNALKFTEQGHVVVTASCVPKADLPVGKVLLRIAVSDTGIGIPAENQEKIFERFTQNDTSTTRRFGGSGLGLSICKQIVTLMEGRIGVESRENKGSTFWFEIPVSIAAGYGQVSAQGTELLGKNIIVVDDAAFTRNLLGRVLRSSGAITSTCASGEDALTLIASAKRRGVPFDVALIDYQMPGMKGDDLARKIRSNPGFDDMPLILVSALAWGHINAGQNRNLFDGAVTKPFLPLGLVRQIKASLERSPAENRKTVHSEAALAQAHRGSATTAADNDTLSGRKILVAEDSAVNQAYVNETLRQFGSDVTIASNGEEALRFAKASEFDLMLIDCHMPIMDGFECSAAITKLMDEGQIQRTPILAFTADAASGISNRCASAGMLEQLTKPIRQDALREALERWLKYTDRVRGKSARGKPASRPSAHSSRSGSTGEPVAGTAQTSQATAADDAMIDEAIFKQGQEILADKFWPLIDRYLEDAAASLTTVETSLQEERYSEIHRPAHSLKSSSRQVGAMRLGNAAAKVEEFLQDDQEVDRVALGPAIEELREAMALTREALDVIRKTAS